MSEKVNDKTVLSLLEVTQSIQKTLSERYKSSFLVKAEMNKLNHYPQSGHCYPDLVEKKDGKVIAQMRAIIWKDDFIRINNSFQRILKEPLKNGIQILFSAKITFDPAYGLALRISDIDPSFSLGELEREKQETIERLKKGGIFNKNKEQKLPLLPQRIAIISVSTSKGYADFLKIIDENSWGYKFFHFLFPALLQGEKAVESIIHQLKQIKKVKSHFDVVAIIRGGGGDVGLSCYNNYQLSGEVALFPMPVITGIGHSTNETVLEMLAFKNAITPTELGDFLLQKFHNFSIPVQKAEEKIIDKTKRKLKEEKLKFHNAAKYLHSVARNMILKNHNNIENQSRTLFQQSNFIFKREKESRVLIVSGIRKGVLLFCNNKRLQIKQSALNIRKDITSYMSRSRLKLNTIEKSIIIMSPLNVLKRGYSITLLNGKTVKSYKQVKEGDILNTLIVDGTIISNVKTIKKSEES